MSKTKSVTKGEYIATQSPNNHFMIIKNGRIVMHAAFGKPMTEKELLRQIENYIWFFERGGFNVLFSHGSEVSSNE